MRNKETQKTLIEAQKSYQQIAKTIAPFVDKVVVEDYIDPRIWSESEVKTSSKSKTSKSKKPRCFA